MVEISHGKEYTVVPVNSVPVTKWHTVFESLSKGEAACFVYNNRQRAHQVRASAHNASYRLSVSIKTRVVAEAIDKVRLYIWKI